MRLLPVLRLRVKTGTLTVGAVFFALGFLPFLADQRRVPITVSDLREDDGVAIHGQSMDMLATADRRKLCDTQVQRWLWRVDPGGDGVAREWWPLTGAPWSPPERLGDHVHYKLHIEVPHDVAPGEWHYQGAARDVCGWWDVLFARWRQSQPILVLIQAPRRRPRAVDPLGNVPALPLAAPPTFDQRPIAPVPGP